MIPFKYYFCCFSFFIYCICIYFRKTKISSPLLSNLSILLFNLNKYQNQTKMFLHANIGTYVFFLYTHLHKNTNETIPEINLQSINNIMIEILT